MALRKSISIINETKTAISQTIVKKYITHLLFYLRQKKLFFQIAHVSIVMVNESKIKQLNRLYHAQNHTTDILVFPYSLNATNVSHKTLVNEHQQFFSCLNSFNQQITNNQTHTANNFNPLFGDIVLCLSVIKKNVSIVHLSYSYLLAETILHGILHLLGLQHNYLESDLQKIYILQADILQKIRFTANSLKIF